MSPLQQTLWLVLRGVQRPDLHVEDFRVADDEWWCVLATDAGGGDLFVRLLAAQEDLLPGEQRVVPVDFTVVGFQAQQEIFEGEVRKDETDFLDRPDPGTPARVFLGNSGDCDELIDLFALRHVLDQGFRQLSSGQCRKLVLLAALTHGSRSLLLENPYDGLDSRSCVEFDRIMMQLRREGCRLLVVVSDRCDVPAWCTHLALIRAGKMVQRGVREEVLAALPERQGGEKWSTLFFNTSRREEKERELVRLENGWATYEGRKVFTGVHLLIRSAQHTLITGANGAGKSTLLSLLSGDHHDCYRNDLTLFGRRRGSGESIWQVKRNMGLVSPELHREHYLPGSVLQVVLSGFFDSIGLYRPCTAAQQRAAEAWLERLGMADKARQPFRGLAYAQQRLVLIARSLIKMPPLFLLDEPTQGLGEEHRLAVLDFLEFVARAGLSTIVYVSHRSDEYRPFFVQHLEMRGR